MHTSTRDKSTNISNTENESLWMQVSLPSFSTLNENLDTDVCIVGGGIIGLTCAYMLALQGKSVVLLEQGVLACGQSSRTTGHLTWVLDDRFDHLESLMGLDLAQEAVKSHLSAINCIEKIIQDENIDCNFERVNAYLFTPPGESQEILEKEYNFIKKMGLEVIKEARVPFNSDFDTKLCLRFPNQAQFHILKYLQGLTQALKKFDKVKIFCQTHVNEIIDGLPCLIKTLSGCQVTASAVIMATCTPVNNRFYVHTKQSSYRTYVIAAPIAKDVLPKGLYYDTDTPYHYIRVQEHLTDPLLDWVIVGGEDHRVGQDFSAESKFSALIEWTRRRIPQFDNVEYQWSGEIFEPIDSLAFIGRNPRENNIYIATGDSGNGLTHGTIAAMLLPDLIMGKDHVWKELYSPSRISFSSAPTFIENMCNVTAQYRDWLTPGESKEIDTMIHGEGMILRKGLQKIAVYKDQNDEIFVLSACCPHLGGCVRWNQNEKTWDCPCHGSSFDRYGNVICGPAIDSLKKVGA